jgi:hypothetical protein
VIEHWIASGQIAPCIIGLTMLELAGLAAMHRFWQLLPNILAGDFLLLAWWLSAAHWQLAALALAGGLAAHLADLFRRMR